MPRSIPWRVKTPVVLALAGGTAFLCNLFLSDYFIRSFVNEADPFAAVPAVATTKEAAAPASVTATASGTVVASASASATPTMTMPTVNATGAGGGTVLSEGRFRNGEPGHFGRGTARLGRSASGEAVLRLEEFTVTGGPDLYVYLTADPAGDGIGSGLSLGKLKGTDGFQNYELPPGADPAAYRAVVIWCRSFDVTFAVATLEVAS